MPSLPDHTLDARAPVQMMDTEGAAAPLTDGVGLCLSGGGYRAMVFHLGVLWRLFDAGVLLDLKRISSVSGGSIAAALLALKWPKLAAAGAGRAVFEAEVAVPLRAMAGTSVDVMAGIKGLLLPGRISDKVADAYDKQLFHGATLQDLPDEPRFVINATNVQSGALWRFSKPYMRDYRVGEVRAPRVALARAVAASSAFPPFLSPFQMDLDPAAFTPNSGTDLQHEPYTSRVLLTDGGVYDNLGLETVWKRYASVLVSDGGGAMAPEPKPASDWAEHAYRVLDLVDNQVRALRKRQVIGSYTARPGDAVHRTGAYWGIRTDIADYGLADALPCPPARTTELAAVPTRLSALDGRVQERLVNWGFAVCDAALRRHVLPAGAARPDFPYPAAGV